MENDVRPGGVREVGFAVSGGGCYVRQFKLNPPGRTRTESPRWRVYHPRSNVLVTEIQVSVRVGQQDRLAEKLNEIQQANLHIVPGTIALLSLKATPN